jgi:hypothetical protein
MTVATFHLFANQAQKAHRLVQKQTLLRQEGKIPQRDLDYVYEIAFLSCFVALENYIEERFVGLLVGKSTSAQRKFKARVPITSAPLAREFIYGGRPYVDLFPYENTERLARRFFKDGYPFSALDKFEREELRLQHSIRNDIAHRSQASTSRFQNMCIGRGIILPKRDLVVKRYLQTPFSINVTRFENHVAQLLSIAQKLEN